MPASRSLIALLVGTVAFFALWIVALKPSGSKTSSQGLGQYQSAINKAHQAVSTSNASNAASGNAGTGSSPTTSTTVTSGGAAASQTSSVSKTSGSTTSSTKSHPVTKSVARTKPVPHLTAKVGAHNPATLARLSTVQNALAAHKLVVMLFYNPQGADDQAVKQELAGVPSSRGRVVKVNIPLSESANFTAVTQQVPVNFSPTLVLIAPGGKTEEIPGLTDRFTILQSVINDTLPSR